MSDKTVKLTPWFPLRTPPVRQGWYEYRGQLRSAFDPPPQCDRCYWNGYQWGYWNLPEEFFWWHLAECEGECEGEWRGLTEQQYD